MSFFVVIVGENFGVLRSSREERETLSLILNTKSASDDALSLATNAPMDSRRELRGSPDFARMSKVDRVYLIETAEIVNLRFPLILIYQFSQFLQSTETVRHRIFFFRRGNAKRFF